jgi:hypothetical protein
MLAIIQSRHAGVQAPSQPVLEIRLMAACSRLVMVVFMPTSAAYDN